MEMQWTYRDRATTVAFGIGVRNRLADVDYHGFLFVVAFEVGFVEEVDGFFRHQCDWKGHSKNSEGFE